MHVIVLGSGVIGTCTARYLARRGAQVTVIDRQPGAALETSFANAAQLVADLVSGRRPAIRHDDLGLSRYGRKAGRNGAGLSLSPA